MLTIADLAVPVEPSKADWNDHGVVILKDALPHDLIDAYVKAWRRDNGTDWPAENPGGYDYCTPYMKVRELADLASLASVHEPIQELIGEPGGMHLNLTGFVTTERDWHQDTYLNPPHVGDYYVAAWYALDDVHPDSGPFQFVPGSHKWFRVTQEKMLAALTPAERVDPAWPKYSERILTPLFEREMTIRSVPTVTYLPKKGDVLLWHSRLLHRGSRANVPGMERRSLIVHYSGIHHRSDMPRAVQYGDGYVFPIGGQHPV